MRRAFIIPSLLACLVFQTFSLAAAGLASAAQPSEYTRYLCWMLGSKLSLAALGHSRGADAQLTDPILAQIRPAAEALGTWIPAFPERSGSETEDTARILNYLMDTAGKTIGRELNLSYPPDHAALFELGMKSNLLHILYYPGDELGTNIATVITDRSKTARLPEYLWSPVVRMVNQQAPMQTVTNAVQKMHKDISIYLAPNR